MIKYFIKCVTTTPDLSQQENFYYGKGDFFTPESENLILSDSATTWGYNSRKVAENRMRKMIESAKEWEAEELKKNGCHNTHSYLVVEVNCQ